MSDEAKRNRKYESGSSSTKGRMQSNWARWRRYRFQEMFADGMPSRLAYPAAAAETKARRALSAIIGDKRAKEADLICLVTTKGIRFALAGPINGLTDHQIDAIETCNQKLAV